MMTTWILLGALVFLLFVQGGQTLIDIVGKTENEKSLIITSIGRKWKLTFTTLVVMINDFSFSVFEYKITENELPLPVKKIKKKR
jgi:cytochrome d ubiquinol oxidase subunit II